MAAAEAIAKRALSTAVYTAGCEYLVIGGTLVTTAQALNDLVREMKGYHDAVSNVQDSEMTSEHLQAVKNAFESCDFSAALKLVV